MRCDNVVPLPVRYFIPERWVDPCQDAAHAGSPFNSISSPRRHVDVGMYENICKRRGLFIHESDSIVQYQPLALLHEAVLQW